MKAQIVSFHCVLKDKVGKVISDTFNHDVITHVEGKGQLLKGLSEGLQNLIKGEKRTIFLSASQAFGFYDPGLVIEVSRKEIPDGEALQPGHEISTQFKNGGIKMFRVTQTRGGVLTLDGNHPLAGQDLEFDIFAIDARDATLEEIAESCIEAPLRSSSGYIH